MKLHQKSIIKTVIPNVIKTRKEVKQKNPFCWTLSLRTPHIRKEELRAKIVKHWHKN